MEELPLTLDDGELWLPSDIFPPDDNHHQVHHNRPLASLVSSMEDLSRQFNGLSFLDRPPKPTSNPERLGMFGPIAHKALTAPSSTGCHALTVGPAVNHGHFNFSQSGPGFQFPDHPALCHTNNTMVQPVHPRVRGRLTETRMARSRTPLLGQPNPPLNSCYTFHPNGSGFRFNSLIRDRHHGPTTGTGVFIPRATTSSLKPPSNGKKLTGVRTQRMSPKAPGLGSGECNQNHQMCSAEVSLPKEWTY